MMARTSTSDQTNHSSLSTGPRVYYSNSVAAQVADTAGSDPVLCFELLSQCCSIFAYGVCTFLFMYYCKSLSRMWEVSAQGGLVLVLCWRINSGPRCLQQCLTLQSQDNMQQVVRALCSLLGHLFHWVPTQ